MNLEIEKFSLQENQRFLLNELVSASTATVFADKTPIMAWESFLKPTFAAKCDIQNPFYDNIGESARNRFGRPYISGRPLLSCDRQRIIQMFQSGIRKIEIARALGVTHSCVSKVIRRHEQTGVIDVGKQSRTASCACPGEALQHNPFICRHLKYNLTPSKCSKKLESLSDKKELPKVFTIEWILSDLQATTQRQPTLKVDNPEKKITSIRAFAK